MYILVCLNIQYKGFTVLSFNVLEVVKLNTILATC